MIDENDIHRPAELHVRKDDWNNIQNAVDKKLSNDSTRFAVIEYQQKVNNWLTTAIAGGIVALVIKVFLGG